VFVTRKSFYQAIIDKTFEIRRSAKRKKKNSSSNIKQRLILESSMENHTLIYRGIRGNYIIYKRDQTQKQPRIILGEVSGNNRVSRYKKVSVYSCSVCDLALQKKIMF
jgi:hypothetical protein